ncbi:MurR/RpiR family transcriptional regulator [Kineococcus sp. LSe6-4]|uniref:MurR/RpiR family transcriptional regulator n=1 Tax=Kineococcus halophytocola TaxID=3234027 RepID=A0ABV4GYX4_9ACTN
MGEDGVRERIERAWAGLSPAERRIAELLLDRADDDLAAWTTAELAAAAGASKASVSRFVRRLGFGSFAQARTAARSARARGVPTGGLPPSAAGPVALHVEHDTANLARTADALARVDLTACTRLLARARRVLVAGWRNSFPVALHLREQLLQARADVVLAPQPGQTVAEEFTGLGPRDAVVLVAFRRRTPHAAAALRLAHAQGVPCVLFTDPAAGPPPVPVAHRFEVPVEGPGAFDSYAAAMTAAAVLAEGVLAARGAAGRERVNAVSAALGESGELDVR